MCAVDSENMTTLTKKRHIRARDARRPFCLEVLSISKNVTTTSQDLHEYPRGHQRDGSKQACE